MFGTSEGSPEARFDKIHYGDLSPEAYVPFLPLLSPLLRGCSRSASASCTSFEGCTRASLDSIIDGFSPQQRVDTPG